MYDDVRAFHHKFGLDTEGLVPPRFLDNKTAAFRNAFLEEELNEFAAAVANRDLNKAGDALADLVYVALGTAHMMGLPFDEIWDNVHRANMMKERASSDHDPRSVRKSSLDVVKPAGWVAPDHTDAIARATARYEEARREAAEKIS